ncbi:MAG: (E)-4-hydroxy-3-methylbut-2-enyl-diphosphate synthase, partial [Ruminococcus sp.]|nr:(E)-4-hydroxy-3-methylbut-2-enyl-diphosphate synthase [Ruminococcus sp.]
MRNVRPVQVGDLTLDGKHIYIQSMLNVPSTDIEGSVEQAVSLEKAGCEIVRAAIPNMDAVKLIPAIKEKISIPLVADIHFDYKLALAAADAGIDKIRINPGNIGDMDRVKAVVKKCTEKHIPIRIGVNGGSLEKDLLAKYGSPCADALVESAMGHVKILEQCDFNDIVISIKSSDVNIMTQAYRKLSQQCDYPLHLGVTEAGTERMGIIKSAVGIGSLLMDGIGETIRVSLTDEPEKEIYAA